MIIFGTTKTGRDVHQITLSDGDLAVNLLTWGAVVQDVRLSMLFAGRADEDCRKWQEKFRKQLEALLGDSTSPKRWRVTEEGRNLQGDRQTR